MPREDFQRSRLEQVPRGRAVQAFQRPRAWAAPTQWIRRWRAGRSFRRARSVVVFAEHAALVLAVDELPEPADGARTLSFAAPDASGFLLSAQQEPADMGLTLLFHTPDAPGFLLSWRNKKD